MSFLPLSSPQLSLPPSTSAQLTSAQLTSAWGPQLAGLTRSHLSRRTSSHTHHAASSWYGRPGPPDLALLDLPRTGWAVRTALPACATLTSRTPQWTQPSNSSTCEPPVIDLSGSPLPMRNVKKHVCPWSKKKNIRKAGKTLLIKPNEGVEIEESWFSDLVGLVSTTKTAKTGSYFLTFDNVGNSLVSLKSLRKKHEGEMLVKFAHYKVFFTITGLSDESDYNTIKTKHSKFQIT